MTTTNEDQLCFWESPPIHVVDITDGPTLPDSLLDYDRYVIFFSGGKDSVACVLYLLDEGVDPAKIELHHHLVDGRENSTLMDWPITDAYCQAFADAFNLKLFWSWKVNGFEGEMLRENSLTAPVAFESEEGGVVVTGGDKGKPSTRLKFPQLSASLSTRWCSSYVKIDVGARILTKEPRFQNGKTLVITGERAQESSNRAKYVTFEPHRQDLREGKKYQRLIDHYRPVHAWSEEQVWDIIEKYGVNPHPAYHLGWGRTSCLACIFGSKDQWATIQKYFPNKFSKIEAYEKRFGVTIHRKDTLAELAAKGTPYNCDPHWVKVAHSTEWTDQMILPTGQWVLPPGAFGESNGPV